MDGNQENMLEAVFIEKDTKLKCQNKGREKKSQNNFRLILKAQILAVKKLTLFTVY
jgi:hypothetical protein